MNALINLGLFFAVTFLVRADVYVQTFAGSGFSGHVNGTGAETMFSQPISLAWDGDDLIVADYFNNCLRRISSNRVVTTIPNSTIRSHRSVAVTTTNFWTISYNHLLRIPKNGGATEGITIPHESAAQAQIVADSEGKIFATNPRQNVIHRYDPITKSFTNLFGSGDFRTTDGRGIFSSFAAPTAITIDRHDTLFVYDSSTHKIRRISPDGNVTTLPGSFITSYPASLATDTIGNTYFSDTYTVTKISPEGVSSHFAGRLNSPDDVDGPAQLAAFSGIRALSADSKGDIFVADAGNNKIKVVTQGLEIQVEPANLAIGNFAGITLTGIVGRYYRLEAAATPGASWESVGKLQLPSSPFLWIDTGSTNLEKRFYRAILLP